MNCPSCINRQLEQLTISGLQLDQCKSCEGIWFDQRELRGILDSGKESSISPELKRSLEGEIKTDEAAGGFHLKCPRCKAELMRYFYGYSSKVLVDGCQSDCGVWIDDGELSILFDYAVKAASELDPGTMKRINSRLDALAVSRKEHEDKFVDSIIKLDDSNGQLAPLGELLQSIVSAIYAAQKKLF